MTNRRSARGVAARRFAEGLALLVFLGSASACATPAVLDQWRAYDRVESIHFAQDDAGGDQLRIHWRVESQDNRRRQGAVTTDLENSACTEVEATFRGEGLPARDDSRWLSFRLDRHELAPFEPENVQPASSCTVDLFLEPWSREADPQVDMIRGDRSLGRFGVHPPRQWGWALAIPFAAIADTILIVGTLGTVVLLDDTPSFTWSPGSKPDFHEDSRDAREGDAP